MTEGQTSGKAGMADMGSVATILTAVAIGTTFLGCLFFGSTWTIAHTDGTSSVVTEGISAWAAWVSAAAVVTTILIYVATNRLAAEPKRAQLVQGVAMIVIGGAGIFAALHMRNLVDRPLAENETFAMAIGLPIATLGCLLASGAIAWSLLLDYAETHTTH